MKYLDRAEEWLIAALLGGATLLIFAAVLHRYLSGLAIPVLQDFLIGLRFSWAQELCIYMLIWMAKFGAAYGVRTGIHVGVDVLVNRLPPRGRGGLIVFGLLAGACFTGIIGALGVNFVWAMVHTDMVTTDMELPKWLVYLAMPLASFLMCLRFLQVALVFWRTGALPRHEHAHVEGLDDAQGQPA